MGKENGSGWEERESKPESQSARRTGSLEVGAGGSSGGWTDLGLGNTLSANCGGSVTPDHSATEWNYYSATETSPGQREGGRVVLVHDALVRSSLDGEVLPLRC